MQNKTSLCVDCPSFLTPPGYCEPVGSGVNQVLLVGSSPDRAAVQLGQAYSPYSEVGTILARACQLREMDLDQFTYTNLTWCPASPKREVLNYCAVKHLRPLIERLQPRMIVALGPDVIRELTGITGPKTDPRYTRGFVVDGINAAAGYPVKLTYDPLMVREGNMNLLGALAQDLDMARTQTRQPFRPNYKVGLGHCASWFFDAKAHPDLGIGVDIETGTSLKNDEDEVRGHSDPITQIQFSIRPGEALILPWSERAREFTKIVMALPNTKLGWNCFAKHTSVLLSTGKWKPIHAVKPGDSVRSVDVDGQAVDKPVTRVFRVKDSRPWVEVLVDGAYNRGVGRWGNPGVVCTPDHKWYSPDLTATSAEDLQAGDPILLPKFGAYDLIHGCVLGDGHVGQNGVGTHRLVVSHTNKEYAEAKARAFGIKATKGVKYTGFKAGKSILYTAATQVPSRWRDFGYLPDGTKKWTTPNDRALAILYGDDGWINGKDKANPTPRIALHAFEGQQETILQEFINRFGPCSLYQGTTVSLSVEASKVFYTAIAPYMHPSVQYKLPEQYKGKYNGWLDTPEYQVGWVKAAPSPPSRPVRGKEAALKYCLEVQDTHKFFTRSGLVANCRLFDWPHLRREGIEIVGPGLDLMNMWHFLEPGLPYNLSHCTGTFVGNELPPWKHTMSADLHRYGGLDVDSLVRIYPRLVEALHAEGMWDAYQTFIVRFEKVLNDMSDRGFPFNLEEAAELREWVEGEKARIFADIQERIPNTLKNVHPKEGYKRKPSPSSPGFKEEEGVMWAWDKDQGCWTKLETRTFGEEERWVRVKPFLVTSSDQIKRYAASKGQQLYKVKDGHKYKESTGKKELMKMVQKYGDPFYKTVIEYRELDKLAGTYLTWPVDSNGRVHAEFNFGPESGQIDTRSPNVNNVPKGTPLAKKIRACVAAAPGHTLAEIDIKGFHAKTLGYCARDASYMRLAALDIHSFLAAHILKLDFADRLMDMEDAELAERLDWVKTKHGHVRNKKAKPCCIAEGQLVLTDKGLVPIERVTLEHKLWDGVEWVTHEGVIFQGYKEVITYAGLTATPDHEVFTRDGRKIHLGQAASEMVWISSAGLSGPEVWLTGNSFAGDTPGRKTSKSFGEMPRDGDHTVDLAGRHDCWSDHVISSQWGSAHEARDSSGKTLRRHNREMQSPAESCISPLWRSRNQVSVRESQTLHTMGDGELAARGLHRGGDRQDRQQRALRAGQSSAGHTAPTDEQPQLYSQGLCEWGVDSSLELGQESVLVLDHIKAGQRGLNGRTDDRAGASHCALEGDKVENNPAPSGTVRVYDVLNAGPRHRFTVSGVLASNCHGIGFGMGVGKLYTMNEESFESRAEAQAIHDLMKSLFPKVFAWQTEIRNLAHAQKFLKTEFGCIRRFYDVFRWDYVRGVWRPGDQAEECIAFPPSNLAHCHIKLAMMRLDDRGLLDKYKLVNFIKDSLVFECPTGLVDECVHEVRRELEAPSAVLIDNEVAPTGFWVGTDVEVGPDWASMKGYAG